jgi:hypothetical protein
MALPKPKPKIPKGFILQERDIVALDTLYDFERYMSLRQFAEAVYKSPITAKRRMRKLFENGYVDQPTATEYRWLPELIYWNTAKGLREIAKLRATPKIAREHIPTEAPQTGHIRHVLFLNDVRLKILHAIDSNLRLSLVFWVNDRTLKTYKDWTAYTRSNGESAKRIFTPDAVFRIRWSGDSGDRYFDFVLEVDRSTHVHTAIRDEKFLPGVSYLSSPAYSRRFGDGAVRRHIFVGKSQERIDNLLHLAAQVKGAQVFCFAPYPHVSKQGFFTEPLWVSSTHRTPFALIDRSFL